MCLINPRYIKKEEEVRIGKILDRITIGEEIGCLVENVVIIVIKVMDEVILEGVVFEVGPVVMLEEMIIEKEVERIGDLGDSLDWEKEE